MDKISWAGIGNFFFYAVLAHSGYRLWYLNKCSDKQVNVNHCLCTCPHKQCGSRTKQASKWAVMGLDFMVLSICPQPLYQKSPSLLVLSIKYPNVGVFLVGNSSPPAICLLVTSHISCDGYSAALLGLAQFEGRKKTLNASLTAQCISTH